MDDPSGHSWHILNEPFFEIPIGHGNLPMAWANTKNAELGVVWAVLVQLVQAFSIGNEVRMKIPPNAICSGLAGVAAVAGITVQTAVISVGQGAVALSRTKPTVIQFVAKCFIAFAIAIIE